MKILETKLESDFSAEFMQLIYLEQSYHFSKFERTKVYERKIAVIITMTNS